MARRITVTKIVREDANTVEFQAALWADVPAARQTFYATGGEIKPTGWVSVLTGGSQPPTTPEANALGNGALHEEVTTLSIGKRNDDGTPKTPAQILAAAKAVMVAAQADFQARINATNPWSRYGTTWDTSPAPNGTWTDRTIA